MPLQRHSILTVLIATSLFTYPTNGVRANESNWPQFRGPGGLGVAPDHQRYPAELDVSRNLLWKTEVPKGHSSPCIWGDRIFITASSGKSLETICMDRGTGNITWRKSVEPEAFEKISNFNSHATPTPVCDGKHVYVHFGSFGLLAYDLDGNEIWRKPLPIPNMQYGSASSPIVANNMVVISRDPEEGAYILAVDRDTGETIWRQARQATKGWSTPVLWKHADQEELVVRGNDKLISYDLRDGSKRWWLYNLPYGATPTPVYAGDTLFVATTQGETGDPVNPIELPDFNEVLDRYDNNKDGRLVQAEIPEDLVLVYRYGPMTGIGGHFSDHDTNKDGAISEAEWNTVVAAARKVEPGRVDALVAIRSGGKDDIRLTHVKWAAFEGLGQVPSPLHYEGRIYLVKHGGIVTCYNAETGDKVYGGKLGPRVYYYASPVAADGKIYFCSLNGAIIVVRAGDEFEILARNTINEHITATPALVDGKVYLRTDKSMYAFASARDDSGRKALAKQDAKDSSPAELEIDQAKTLHDAAADGDIQQAKSLIAGGADVNARNNWGWTPLYTAAAVGHGDMVKLLVANGANVDTPSEQGMTPLFFALNNGKTGIATLLIETGADCNTRDRWGRTPLLLAVASDYADIARLLIENGANVNAATKPGRTPLHAACNGGNKEIAELLINKGANINARDAGNVTPLHAASQSGHKGVVELLLAKGADLGAQNKFGRTALGMAKENGHMELFELLRGHVSQLPDSEEIMTLYDFAAVGDIEEIKLLVREGMDVNAKTQNGTTALHFAARSGHTAVAEYLISKGADMNTKNNNGQAPLLLAGGHKEISELLIAKGADVNTKDNNGQTPLFLAAQQGQKDVVELLISKGANVNAETNWGGTPLMVAENRGYPEIIELLRKHGAKEQ